MQHQLRISYRGVRSSGRLEETIRAKAAKLDQVHGRLSRCDVVVERASNRREKGDRFVVRIRLTLPGGEIVVDRDGTDTLGHEDVYAAVRSAFEAARRQLDSHVSRHGGQAKRHDGPARPS